MNMVQVDVFWAYGLGASLAVAAGRQLATRKARPFESRYFVWTILFLALVWAPTGMLLLLRHPSWETMQAADTLASMPPWLVLGFGLTNVTQGIVGFWTGLLLMRRGSVYLANLNWIAGYFGMFFILVYGWDGLGYDRFFYDRDQFAGAPAWTAGAGTGGTILGTVAAAWRFLFSGVALTLYIDGLLLIPPLAALMYLWHAEALRDAGHRVTFWGSGPIWLSSYLCGIFVVGLGSALVCAGVVNYLGAALGVGEHIARGLGQVPPATAMHVCSYILGLPLALGLLWFTLLKPGGIAHRLLSPWCVGDQPRAMGTVPSPAAS
ncbi:MAG TPA: hypothetical protein VLI06_11405 [Solimonas sp.]|nr:hypothetical protein [Solimonas sp.]